MKDVTDGSAQTQRLLERVRSGDSKAVDQLLAYFRSYLCQVIRVRLDNRLGKRLDVSDIVQETQMEISQRLEDYLEHEPMPLRPWLHQIARNQLLKAQHRHLGAAKRAMSKEMPLPEESALLLAKHLLKSGSSPSQHVARKELVLRVLEELGRLSEADREILLMRNFEELSFEEIGYVLNIDPAPSTKTSPHLPRTHHNELGRSYQGHYLGAGQTYSSGLCLTAVEDS